MELSEEQQSGIIEVVVIIKGYKQPGEQQPLPPLFLFFFLKKGPQTPCDTSDTIGTFHVWSNPREDSSWRLPTPMNIPTGWTPPTYGGSTLESTNSNGIFHRWNVPGLPLLLAVQNHVVLTANSRANIGD